MYYNVMYATWEDDIDEAHYCVVRRLVVELLNDSTEVVTAWKALKEPLPGCTTCGERDLALEYCARWVFTKGGTCYNFHNRQNTLENFMQDLQAYSPETIERITAAKQALYPDGFNFDE